LRWRIEFDLNVEMTPAQLKKLDGRLAPRRPLFRKIDCLRLQVPDLEAGLAFYRDRLGHALIWRSATAVALRLPESEAEIVLTTDESGTEIDLQVDSADRAAASIVEAGGRVVQGPFDIPIGRCVVVADPWGTQLVLLDVSRGLLATDAEGNVTGNLPPSSPDALPPVRS
jgi:predicted enzyme related to lactoylglutathione lyase